MLTGVPAYYTAARSNPRAELNEDGAREKNTFIPRRRSNQTSLPASHSLYVLVSFNHGTSSLLATFVP